MADPIYNVATTPFQNTVQPVQLNTNFANNANQIRTNVQDPNLVNQQVTDALYKQQTQYLDPQFQRTQSALENQLANQGITQGSEAYNNAMQQANANKQQAYESARNSAIGAGVNAGSQMFQNQLAGMSAGNQALGQQFNQGLTSQQAGNTALTNQFGMGLNNANLFNTAAGQQFNQGLSNAQLTNQEVQNQRAIDLSRENATKMADAMKTGGMFSLGGALLGSPTGNKLAGSALSGLGGLGSSALSGLGGLFGTGAALPDWATGITDAQTLEALGLGGGGGLGGLFGVDPTGGYLTALMGADKLTGGKLGIGNTVNDVVGGAANAVSDIGSSIGDFFGW